MKISTCLKISLFAIICYALCLVGFFITDIEMIYTAASIAILISYCGLVTALCMKIYPKIRKYKWNSTISIITFAMCLYTGIKFYCVDSFIFEAEPSTITYIAFIFFTIACLISLMLLIGRAMFTKKQ